MYAFTPNPLTHMTEEQNAALTDRGLAIYDEKLKPILEPAYDKKFVAIHVDTEEYAVANSSADAMRAIRKRQPQGYLVMMKIGNEPEWGLAARLFGRTDDCRVTTIGKPCSE